MLKKTKFWVHCVVATAFIFGFMWVSLEFLAIFNFLDPIGDALTGYEITDQVFSNPQWREAPPVDTSVVIVNIGLLSRAEIAKQINIIRSFEPKVIGIDAIFRTLKPDTLGDLMLADALAHTPNVVMYAKLKDPDSTGLWHNVSYSHPIFTQDHVTASVNLINEEANALQYNFKTCRSFFPREYLKNNETGKVDTVLAFGVELVKEYDPQAAREFLARKKTEEIINYRGNVVDFGRTRLGTRYFALDAQQVLDTAFTEDLLKDKIVLMGFLGENFDDTRTFEDKYFTPLNTKYTGRANPDMFGVVVHANIISMLLNRDYVNEMKTWESVGLAVVICFLNVIVFSMIYYKLDSWYDGLTKLLQLAQALLLIFVIILFFYWFNFKLDLSLTIVAVLFAGDSLEVYYGVIANLYEKIVRKLITK